MVVKLAFLTKNSFSVYHLNIRKKNMFHKTMDLLISRDIFIDFVVT